MGVIPNQKVAFFPISCILVLIFPFFIIYIFPNVKEKGSLPKSLINSLDVIVGPDLGLNCLRETSSLIHYIYRGITAFNFKIKLHFFL